MSENAASSRRTATRSLVLCALMAALTAICSQIQIPLPMVPINLALFAVHLSGALLGWKYGALSMVVYALLGVIGVPVFAGFGSGPAVLFGKTGGYILGYILCALIVGALSRKFAFNFKTLCLSMVLGVAVCYTFGTIWFMAVTGLNLATSMSYCVIPFLPGDAVKILLAVFLALRLRRHVNDGIAKQGSTGRSWHKRGRCVRLVLPSPPGQPARQHLRRFAPRHKVGPARRFLFRRPAYGGHQGLGQPLNVDEGVRGLGLVALVAEGVPHAVEPRQPLPREDTFGRRPIRRFRCGPFPGSGCDRSGGVVRNVCGTCARPCAFLLFLPRKGSSLLRCIGGCRRDFFSCFLPFFYRVRNLCAACAPVVASSVAD